MPKSISWKKLVKKLKRLGFAGPHPGSRHLFMKKDDFRISIPNPHRGYRRVGEIINFYYAL